MNVRKMIVPVLGIVLISGLLASSAAAESRTHLLIVDLRHNGAAGFTGSKTAALSYLDNQVKSGDEASLLTLSSIGGIQVIEDLTADAELLRKKIVDLRGIPEQLNGVLGEAYSAGCANTASWKPWARWPRGWPISPDRNRSFICLPGFPFPYINPIGSFTTGSTPWPKRSERPARPLSPSMPWAGAWWRGAWTETITSSGSWPIFPAGGSAGLSMI